MRKGRGATAAAAMFSGMLRVFMHGMMIRLRMRSRHFVSPTLSIFVQASGGCTPSRSLHTKNGAAG
jgi:hypothetical protein